MRFDGQKIAVIHGGLSHERAVSLSSGKAIAKALRDAGHTVVLVDAERDLPTQLRAANPAVVFIALHGTYGEDGRVQGLLDWMGLPYTGEGLEASHRGYVIEVGRQTYAGQADELLSNDNVRRSFLGAA